MAFQEFYLDFSGGSNLNGGSPIGAPYPLTYTNEISVSSWNAATGVFVTASGSPSVDGVQAGDFASVYVTAGATVAVFITRVSSADATSISVFIGSNAAGSPPATDSLGATTIKVGGAWKGPNAAEKTPFNLTTIGALTNAAGNQPRFNMKSGTTYGLTAAVTSASTGPYTIEGYTTTVGDGGRATWDAGTTDASFTLLNLSGNNTVIKNLIFGINGDTSGSATGVAISGVECMAVGCVFHTSRGTGCSVASNPGTVIIECEFYGNNVSNTASLGGFTSTQQVTLLRCISHDNAGSNTRGFRVTSTGSPAILIDCIADTNGSHGFDSVTNTNLVLVNCDAYANGGSGVTLDASSACTIYIENTNLIDNVAWGILGSGAGTMQGFIINCGFGSGTAANGSGTTSALSQITELASVTYAADVTPYNAPTTGDFRITLATAKNDGRGTFTLTAASYTGTVGFPDIGAAQHLSASGGETAVGRSS